jgi:hypothetical protein
MFSMENSTVSGNSASYGGGLANQKLAILRNVTISGNSAVNAGGGISQWNDGNLTLFNTTVADNEVTGGSTNSWGIAALMAFYAYNSILSAAPGMQVCSTSFGLDDGDHNITTDSSCGTIYSTVADPRIGPLSVHGSTWLHTLLLGSPAIDDGDPDTCEPYDQRGISRPIDGNGDGLVICDIGAYEAFPAAGFLPLLIRP